MPANLTPEYLDAEQEYKAARTHQERIAALERMLATVPKHKGTEKLQADIKRRLSQARKEAHKKGGSRSAPVYLVEKEGAGQLALIGPPNSGKSSLVAALTHAEPEIAEFPFSTRLPCPGMMEFENVQIQLVDLPPLSREFMEPWLPQAIRHVGEGILVVDISDPELLEEIEFIEGLLEERRLKRPRMLVANKSDLDPTGEDFQVLKDLLGERYRMLAVSAATGANLDRFRKGVFDLLELVRVYTKRPGKPADLTSPYVLRRGATVLDAARHVHKDFAERLKYARLYTKDGRRDGLMVERTHLVKDEDILEFHV